MVVPRSSFGLGSSFSVGPVFRPPVFGVVVITEHTIRRDVAIAITVVVVAVATYNVAVCAIIALSRRIFFCL